MTIFFQLITRGSSPYVTSSLMRGWVCHLQLLLVLASAIILSPSPAGLITYFIVSNSTLPQPGGRGTRIYIPQEQGGPVIPPGIGFLFRHLLRLAGLQKTMSSIVKEHVYSSIA
jgi:hypothetical protein